MGYRNVDRLLLLHDFLAHADFTGLHPVFGHIQLFLTQTELTGFLILAIISKRASAVYIFAHAVRCSGV
ncbi:hypothetical protein D3C80_2101770 [compost metagenome]